MARQTSDAPIQRVLYCMVDAGQSLGVSKPVLYGLIEDGTLATVLIGKRRFTTPEMLRACVAKLAARRVPAPSEVPNNRHRPRKAARE